MRIPSHRRSASLSRATWALMEKLVKGVRTAKSSQFRPASHSVFRVGTVDQAALEMPAETEEPSPSATPPLLSHLPPPLLEVTEAKGAPAVRAGQASRL